MTTTHWIVCYDISDDKPRKAVFDTLSDHGHPLQYSVFQLPLTKPRQMALRQQLQQHLCAGDSIRWYPLCAHCVPNTEYLGAQATMQPNDYFLV